MYLLITLFAANGPHKATEIALLVPLITDVSALPHFGQRIDLSIGAPQLGQAFAVLETVLPHSGQLINAIILNLLVFISHCTAIS